VTPFLKERFATQAEALMRRAELKSAGFLGVTATPAIDKKAGDAAMRARQSAFWPNFRP
jgi:hypothetical protein